MRGPRRSSPATTSTSSRSLPGTTPMRSSSPAALAPAGRSTSRSRWRSTGRSSRGQGRSASLRRAAVRGLQSALRAAGRRAAGLPGPRLMTYRVNAGRLAADHWTNDLARGGGQVEGRGMPLHRLRLRPGGDRPAQGRRARLSLGSRAPLAATDNFSLQIAFADGGVGTIALRCGRPGGPGQGAIRDQRSRWIRGDRGLQSGSHLARVRRRKRRLGGQAGQGVRSAVRATRRGDPGEGSGPTRRASSFRRSRHLPPQGHWRAA